MGDGGQCVCVSISAVDLVQQLLTVSASSTYWLAKVELLRTLACLPLTALALSLPSLPHSLLSLCVFPLLGDSDHRSAIPITVVPQLTATFISSESEQLLQKP